MVEASDGSADVAAVAATLVGSGATVAREGAGWDHVAWRVTGADGVPWIVRLATADGHDDPSTEVQREVSVMRAARAVLGDLVAAAVAADGAMAYPRLPGVPLQDLLAVDAVPDAAQERLAGEIGAVVRAVGTVSPPSGVPVEDGLPVWLAEVPSSAAAVDHLLTDDVRAAVDRFQRMRPPSDPDPADLRFAHNDLGAEHVLVDPATFAITGIIDWSDAAIADQAADVGRLLRDLGDRHVGAVLDGMQVSGPARPGVLERAWCYARCLVLEDLAYAVTNRPDLVEHELASARRLFADV